MHLKINSPFLTRFVFSTKAIGLRGSEVLRNYNSQWRYVFEDLNSFTTETYRAGTVVGTRRDRSLPLLCVKLDHCDYVLWIPVQMLKYFHTGGKVWTQCEYRTVIRGGTTEYRVRATSVPITVPQLTPTIRSSAMLWREDYAANRSILSIEDAASYVLPSTFDPSR